MRKVAFFISAPVLGGVEKVFCTYANELAELGNNVSFIMCHNASLGGLISSKVNVVNFNVPRARQSIGLLRQLMRKEHFDFIICSNVQSLFVVLARVGLRIDTKIVSSQHFYCNNIETPVYYRYLLRIIYSKCDKVFAVSEGILKELIETIHLPSRKAYLLKNPINRKEIIELSKQEIPYPPIDYIIWVGRMNAVKNLGLLFESFKQVLKIKDIMLLLVGDGDKKNELERCSIDLGIDNKVIFVGPQSNPYKFISRAKLVVLSSTSEAYPTVLLEAQALGKTVVSTPTEGAKNILSGGKYGYLAVDFSVNSFTKEILRGLERPIPNEILVKESEKSDVKSVTISLCKLLDSI